MKKLADIQQGEVLTIEAAAKLLGMSKRTLYEWHLKSKTEPEKYPRGSKMGGIIFFSKKDLIERLNKGFNQAS